MDDYTIRATPAQLVSVLTDISKSTYNLKSAFSEMNSIVQRTTTYWTGDAAELHRTLFKEQVPQVEAIIARFVDQADRLKQIADNYSGAIQDTKALVEDLPSDVIM